MTTPLSKQAQKELDDKMYRAFKGHRLAEFKQALREGANPDASHDDAFFKGERLITQAMKSSNLHYLVALLEAGASFDQQRRGHTVLGDAAIEDFNRNGNKTTEEANMTAARARLNLLFAASGELTPEDRHMIEAHRKSETHSSNTILSYAERVGKDLPRPTPESIERDHHIVFDADKCDENVFLRNAMPTLKVTEKKDLQGRAHPDAPSKGTSKG